MNTNLVSQRQFNVASPVEITEAKKAKHKSVCPKGSTLLKNSSTPDGIECPPGSKKPLCSKINNLSECPTINNDKGKLVQIGFTNPQDVTSEWTITCEYPIQIDPNSTSPITDFVNATDPTDPNISSMLREECFKPTSNSCPVDPATGQPMPFCSVYISETTDGSTCRSNLQTSSPDTLAQDMNDYCQQHNTPDCQCITRKNKRLYDALRPGISGDEDGCWWKSCSDALTYLVPPSLQSPDNCEKVRQKVASTINQNVNALDCASIQRNVIYAPNGVNELPVRCSFNDALLSQETWSQKYGWLLIIIIVVIFVAVLALIITGVYKYYDYKNYRMLNSR